MHPLQSGPTHPTRPADGLLSAGMHWWRAGTLFYVMTVQVFVLLTPSTARHLRLIGGTGLSRQTQNASRWANEARRERRYSPLSSYLWGHAANSAAPTRHRNKRRYRNLRVNYHPHLMVGMRGFESSIVSLELSILGLFLGLYVKKLAARGFPRNGHWYSLERPRSPRTDRANWRYHLYGIDP